MTQEYNVLTTEPGDLCPQLFFQPSTNGGPFFLSISLFLVLSHTGGLDHEHDAMVIMIIT
jgi:hypothetical protein